MKRGACNCVSPMGWDVDAERRRPCALEPCRSGAGSVSGERFSRDAASGFAVRYRAVAPLKQAGHGAFREC